MNRRLFLGALLAVPMLPMTGHASPEGISVAKSPTCGCCQAWIEHLRAAGFTVDAADISQDMLYRLKAKLGITPELASCHTAQISGYFIEGHVPADDIRRLLAERPKALGLAVPGMPIGSPGMEMGDQRDPYDTLLVTGPGASQVFARHH